MSIGAKVRKYREAKGFSQEELAVRLDVAQTTISSIESDKSIPNSILLHKIAKESGVKLTAAKKSTDKPTAKKTVKATAAKKPSTKKTPAKKPATTKKAATAKKPVAKKTTKKA